MKCKICGTENNFDWATFCRNCQAPLNNPESAVSSRNSRSNQSTQLSGIKPKSELNVTDENDKIEIGISDPMDFIMGASHKSDSFTSMESPEPINPEPVESELTLYRDQAIKLSIAESGEGAKVMVESLKDNLKISTESLSKSPSVDEASKLEVSDSIIPSVDNYDAYVEEPSDQPAPPPLAPVEEPDEPGEDAQEIHSRLEAEPSEPKPNENATEKTPNKPTLSEVKLSKGVIYLTGKNLKLSGGMKILPGDEITIKDKLFEVREKPGLGKLFYIGVGVAAALILGSAIMLASSSSKNPGQLVGIAAAGSDGRPMAGQQVTIDELNRTVTTNQAGFFVFEQLPPGIYTLRYQTPHGGGSDRITVLKNQTSTSILKESAPQKAAAASANQTTAVPEKSRSNKSEDNSGSDKGTLKLTLTPSNASVLIDGKPLGVGSNTYKLASGTYTLTVKKSGFVDKTQEIVVDQDKTLALKINLAATEQPGAAAKSDGELAYENETAGNFHEAARYYDKVLDKNQRDIGAILGKARCARAQGLVENALTYYMQAAKLSADKGDVNSQIASLTGVIDMKPNVFTAYSARGELLYGLGQYDRAVDDFSKVIEMDSRNLSAYYRLGDSFYKTSNYSEALKTFLAAQKLNFADPKAEAYLAKTYLALGDKRNSKRSYEKFKELASYSTRLEFKRDPEWQKVLAALGEKD